MEVADGETWRRHWEIADETKDAQWHYLRHENVERLSRAICHLTPILRSVVEIHRSSHGAISEIAFVPQCA
jgi:DNA-directed RNA polymerase specialized sigma24 family protein